MKLSETIKKLSKKVEEEKPIWKYYERFYNSDEDAKGPKTVYIAADITDEEGIEGYFVELKEDYPWELRRKKLGDGDLDYYLSGSEIGDRDEEEVSFNELPIYVQNLFKRKKLVNKSN